MIKREIERSHRGGSQLAKKKVKVKRVASVDANGVLMRDMRQTAIWVGIALVVSGILAVVQKSIF